MANGVADDGARIPPVDSAVAIPVVEDREALSGNRHRIGTPADALNSLCVCLPSAATKRDSGGVALLAAIVTFLVLPGGTFDSVQPAGGRLLVSGSSGTSCVWLAVDPASLRSSRSRGSCTRPLQAGEPAVPVVISNHTSQWQTVRIARVGRSVSYGPVVMRYQDGSDTRPVWAYGAGSLWLYDVYTDRGSELLRFSSRTGRLEQTVAMPKLFRPVIAANEDGLYLMAAVNGGVSGPGPAALYYVAPSARSATIIHREGRAAFWIAAHAHAVWAEIISGKSSAALWRFDGRKAQARRLWRRTIVTAPIATYGDGSLWAVTPNWAGRYSAQCKNEVVSRINPLNGRESEVATASASGFCSLLFDPQGLTFFRGSVYFLSGTRLYRVRP